MPYDFSNNQTKRTNVDDG